jgi:hypothetical protein
VKIVSVEKRENEEDHMGFVCKKRECHHNFNFNFNFFFFLCVSVNGCGGCGGFLDPLRAKRSLSFITFMWGWLSFGVFAFLLIILI